MDIKLEKKAWYVRYRYRLVGGMVLAGLIGTAFCIALGPDKLRVKRDSVQLAEVKDGKFMEYVDVEGIVQPILTIKVNAVEGGTVNEILEEEGSMLKKGDVILRLSNPELLRTIEDERDEFRKQQVGFREKEIEMEQQSLNLKQQALQSDYELRKLEKSIELDREEYKMGVKSKAQLEVSQDEYNYQLEKARLQREGLRHDSAMTVIRKAMLRDDRNRAQKQYERASKRVEDLVVRSPVDGQLSYVKVTPGQQIAAGNDIAEIKVLSQYKIHTSLSEYYIDRMTTGLPASISYQGEKYNLRVSKVVPEVKDRMFDVDLVFAGDLPDNVRIGKSFRIQIELGQPEKAIVVPRGNFYQATGGQWIYKVSKDRNKAVKVPVRIGRQNPRQYEILEGLEPGDLVITAGYDTFGEAEELILK